MTHVIRIEWINYLIEPAVLVNPTFLRGYITALKKRKKERKKYTRQFHAHTVSFHSIPPRSILPFEINHLLNRARCAHIIVHRTKQATQLSATSAGLQKNTEILGAKHGPVYELS